MDLLIIIKDGLENSILTNLLLAMDWTKAGSQVGILFTEESLPVLAGDGFTWSALLRDRVSRAGIGKVCSKQGVPVYEHPTKRYLHVDTRKLLGRAKEAGVDMYACPMWTEFLGLEEELPSELARLSKEDALKMVQEAKKVLGNF